ncbi:MAG TPA: ABC transporter ATP-binding protein [Candidatus Omnitrophota bacterium]|nr:ABC transporter ATP-binding protein [Candidatus Omnitrophota bacterium]
MQGYLQLLKFLKGHKRLFGISVVAMFFSSIFEGFQLSFLIPITDRIFNNRPIVLPNKVPESLTQVVNYLNSITPEALFWSLPFVALILIIVKNIFTFLYGYLMNDVAQRVLRDVRMNLYEKIQSFSLDYFSKKRTGELISRITNDVSLIENAVSYAVTDLFTQTFLLITYVCIALTIHFYAAAVTLLILVFVVWPVGKIGRKIKKLALGEQQRMADINSTLLETISGVKVIKAFCTEQQEIKRFYDQNYQYYKLKMKTIKRMKLLAPVTEVFGLMCGILIIFWLGRQVMAGDLSFGVFAVFLASALSIVRPIKKLGNVNAIVQQALSANERIYAVLNEEPTIKERQGAIDAPVIAGSIEFKGVDFQYDAESQIVLKDINLTIHRGELVAIVGPTGSGKTSLVNLIPRFYDPLRGEVLLDGKNLKDLTFRSLRRQIGIVAQETFLFNDTIAANINYGGNHSAAEIEEAARQAYAHQFIIQLPHGYDTVIGERGFRLSGGEKQRIAIARAILRNPAILIMDEATSALDSESEKYVKEALDDLMRGRTVVAIAHRLSTIIQANRIVVLEDGKIREIGRHEELLAKKGLYERLYRTQFDVE